MTKINDLENKKILILGLGKEGISTLKFLRRLFPKKILGAGDSLEFKYLELNTKNLLKKDKKIKKCLGKDYLKFLKDYDLIIKSPGISPKTIKSFLKKSQEVSSQTKIFFQNCPGKIIGITGTKGKSTTSSLIYTVLKENGFNVHLVGNIGKPALSFLRSAKEKDIYVYELSSHQLLGVKKSPQVAVLLNVYPEHLDYYKSFKEYAKAKSNISKYQKKEDVLIYNSDNKIVREIAKKSKAKKIKIQFVKEARTFFSQGKSEKNSPSIFINKCGVNINNIKAAIAVGRVLNISDKNIIKGIKRFKPLPHRLEYVGLYHGVNFYNDALSTIPEATIAALDSLGEKVETIFLGGFDRNLKFDKLAKRIIESKIIYLILFPGTGERIWEEILKQNKNKKKKHRAFYVQNMKDGVSVAFKFTKKGKICLLSTASPSFGLFTDYKEKGNLFKKYVKEHGQGS